MTDQELIDGIVNMTVTIGTNYTETQVRDALSSKSTQELQVIYDRAKRHYDFKFPPIESTEEG